MVLGKPRVRVRTVCVQVIPMAADLNERIDAVVNLAVGRARALHSSPLARDVGRLSRLFTTDRAERSQGYLRDPSARRAYLGFYVPLNAAKLALLLAQLVREGLAPAWEAPRVLDLGAGPWTGLLAVRAAAGALGASFAVDQAGGALEDGRALFEAAFPGEAGRIGTRVTSITTQAGAWQPPQPVDLVIMANVLNEIGDPRRAQEDRLVVIQSALDCLAPGGRLLIVEPGTRVHSRALMSIRDAVRERDIARVLAPCRGAPVCPLLRSAGDWCHQDIPWRSPDSFACLEREAQLPKDLLKLSHVLLARPDEAREPEAGLRLVGGTMRDRDAVERRYGCGRDGLVTLVGSKRLPPQVGAPPRGGLLPAVPPGAGVEARGPPRPAPDRRRR